MRKPTSVWVGVLVVAAMCSAIAQSAQKGAADDRFVGTWTGTWAGVDSGSGGFELTLEKEKDKDSALSGRVSVTGEPTYKATLKTLSFDGNKMKATYDFPPNDSIEILLTASFEGNKADGAWSAREKATNNEVATGTWTVAKK